MAKARAISGLDAHTLTSTNARIIAHTRLEELQAWSRYAHDPQRSNELHDMRIAAKRLRYTLEIFAEVLPQETSSIIEEVTQIQEELGAIHDSDVMAALLSLCLEQQKNSKEHPGSKRALAVEAQQKAGKRLVTNLDLIAHLLDSRTTPTPEQQDGLARLLRDTQQQRKEQYTVFREHWDELQKRKFSQEVLDILDV